MPFKEYSNPLYESVKPEDWTSGLCCLFANALRERFNMPMRALLVRSRLDGSKTLVHTFGVLPGSQVVDALGIRTEAELRAEYDDYTERDWRELHCARPGEELDVVFEDVTLGHLWSLNPEDHEATNAAHEYIDSRPDLFGSLSMVS
ncbi:TPA: hypothetical protein QDB04_000141 [Burkholderia vietnamiensis]|nr:hypothetical protein [Burkholderia vietnamiensis]